MCVVKGNTPGLFDRIEHAFHSAGVAPAVIQHGRGHGREDVRCLRALDAHPDDLADVFPHVRQIYQIERTRISTKTHETLSTETVYALTAASAERLPPAAAAQAIRDHWRIENVLHRQKDVRMQEDHDRTHTRHSAHNLAAIRNLSLILLRQATAHDATWEQRWRTVAKQPWRVLRLITGRAAA
ncbi:MAG: ISAs1 family transposase [Planctomycetota bacterium]